MAKHENTKLSKTSAAELILSGYIADLDAESFSQGRIYIKDGFIDRIERCEVHEKQFILPGFIDSHVHIESSMVVPSEFAREDIRHGVVSVLADPHEIANICGMSGFYFMLNSAEKSGFKFYFGAPSCIPATPFDIAGATLEVDEIKELFSNPRVTHLAEMMNFPGVINSDPDVLAKINLAKELGKPIDGHAPGLSGDDLRRYVKAGISTDHEAIDICEAEEKIALGMKILIREGSAAKNFEKLYPLINTHPSMVMLSSDDCHPDDLIKGSINLLVKRGLEKGLNIFKLLKVASQNPVEHYRLNVGLLREGDPADMIVVDSIDNLNILQTIIDGQQVFLAPNHISLSKEEITDINNFQAERISALDLVILEKEGKKIRVIEVIDKELYTQSTLEEPLTNKGNVIADVKRDLLKIVVLNRYKKLPPAVGFVKGFGFKKGAICSSIAHDSHNIIAIGADDQSIVDLINMVIEAGGGIGIHDGSVADVFALPIAGIMSGTNATSAATAYERMQNMAHSLGTPLTSPFMTMAFLSLIVIPQLKLSSLGLFDVEKFEPVDLFA